MKHVFHSLSEAAAHFEPSALTIGNFDGVHLGHRTLIHQAQQIAFRHGWKTGVLTFDPHPTTLVAPERTPKMLCSLNERLDLLQQCGADQILVLPFTAEVAAMGPEEFVRSIISETLQARAVVVGQNFRFGHRQAGDPEMLANLGVEAGFETHFIAPIVVREEIVSSSAIRQHLSHGGVSRANRLLGRCFSLTGTVISGHGIGTKQTVPTLNLRPENICLPARGVYITETEDSGDGRRWQSITNIGYRPTFGGDDLSIETYLLSPFDGRTPEHIRLHFCRFVRNERKFENAEELKQQIFRDAGRAQRYWRRVEKLRTNRIAV